MKIDLSDEDAARLVVALEQYHAYLRVMQREDRCYLELAEELKALRKPPGAQRLRTAPKRTTRRGF